MIRSKNDLTLLEEIEAFHRPEFQVHHSVDCLWNLLYKFNMMSHEAYINVAEQEIESYVKYYLDPEHKDG